MQWKELQELSDFELVLNNRPLRYVEEDHQMLMLTPVNLMFEQPGVISEEYVQNIDDATIRKRPKYVEKCKTALWSRWSTEYLRGLPERHNLKPDERTYS